jgi:hypothetical protein
MSRKVRRPQETRTKEEIAKAALDLRKVSKLEQENIAERVRQSIRDPGA